MSSSGRLRAVIEFTGARKARLVEEPLEQPGPDDLLVRTTRTLVSVGTESICYARNFAPGTHFDQWVSYPFRPGYLSTGYVEAIGTKVTGFRAGDRVATRSIHASHALVLAAHAVPIPAAVTDEEATWMGLGKITQLGVRAAEHDLGDTVAVIGLGMLGQLVVQYASLQGAREIFAIDPWPTRLQRIVAPVPVPIHRIAASAEDALAEVKKLTGGRGVDVVYDVTGHHAVFSHALRLARSFGRVVLLGDTGQPHLQTLTPDVVTRGVRIVGAHDLHAPQVEAQLGMWTERRISELFLHFVAHRQISVAPLITHRFMPADAASVYELLQTSRQQVMGVVFEW